MAEPREKGAGSGGVVRTSEDNAIVGGTISQNIAIAVDKEHR